jgi:laminin alpha 1/2
MSDLRRRSLEPPSTQRLQSKIEFKISVTFQIKLTKRPISFQTCNCHAQGSRSSQCEQSTGACSCRPGFAGMQCDRCIQPGFYGFPMCQRCDCHPTGTDTLNTNGHCHQQDGQCPCKANVMGRRCDTCKDSTFGLLQVGPASTETDQHQHQELMTRHSFDDGGCTPCFCFGRSSSCTQAQLFWSQVKMSTPFHLVKSSTPLLGFGR